MIARVFVFCARDGSSVYGADEHGADENGVSKPPPYGEKTKSRAVHDFFYINLYFFFDKVDKVCYCAVLAMAKVNGADVLNII